MFKKFQDFLSALQHECLLNIKSDFLKFNKDFKMVP